MIVLKFQAGLVKELFCDILLWFDVRMDFAKYIQREYPFDFREKNMSHARYQIIKLAPYQFLLVSFCPFKAAFNPLPQQLKKLAKYLL